MTLKWRWSDAVVVPSFNLVCVSTPDHLPDLKRWARTFKHRVIDAVEEPQLTKLLKRIATQSRNDPDRIELLLVWSTAGLGYSIADLERTLRENGVELLVMEPRFDTSGMFVGEFVLDDPFAS